MEPVDLEIIGLERPLSSVHAWHPFGGWGSTPNFDASWWSRSHLPTSRLLRAEIDGVEVARVEIERDPKHVSPVGLVREIYYIEVSQACRRQGTGPKVVERLVAESWSARLVVSTNTAVRWWTKLVWQRFAHPERERGGWVCREPAAVQIPLICQACRRTSGICQWRPPNCEWQDHTQRGTR